MGMAMDKDKSKKSQKSDKRSVPLTEYLQLTKGQSISRGMKARKQKNEDDNR